MQRTFTFLMFVGDKCGKAEEAMNLYTSLLPNSKIESIERWKAGESGGVEGQVKVATFVLDGQAYMASDSSAPHNFNFTPSFSIFVNCKDEAELARLHEALKEGGAELMPLDNYGFSKKFAWVADRFGVSWQLNLPN